jgi:choline kinase/phosphatidylglycerophosphate synthase
MPVKCIIVAAGMSTRLRPLTKSIPKCLLSIGGKTILQRTIEALFASRIEDIALVVGFEAGKIRDHLGENFPQKGFRFIDNPNFASTSNAYSLHLAREYFIRPTPQSQLKDSVLILDSDILFDAGLIQFLHEQADADTFAIRVKGEHEIEEIRVSVDEDRYLIRIGKDVPVERTYGESIGIEHLTYESGQLLFEVLARRVNHGTGTSEYYEAAFQEMIDRGCKFRAVDVSNFPSIEIDSLSDLERAERDIVPLIDKRSMYDYAKSVKSSFSDELINTHAVRPLAGLIVRLLYNTGVTPNQVTIASVIAGLAAAFVYLQGSTIAVAFAGLLVTTKDILDSADGQLARAKQQYSRLGRFLDSIGDFIVDVAIFGAIGWMLSLRHGNLLYAMLSFFGIVGITFRVTYHVFYQTSFLHLEQQYQRNRLMEEVSQEDKQGDCLAFRLQQIFLIIYGWQDRLVSRIDGWCFGGGRQEDYRRRWYADAPGIRLSGLLGMGTELFLLMAFSLVNRLEFYLYVNLIALNGLLLFNIAYRRYWLRRKLKTHFAQNPS